MIIQSWCKGPRFLEETLSDVEVDVDDLIGDKNQADEGEATVGGTDEGRTNEGKAEIENTLEFGRSLTTEADLKRYADRGWFDF